MLAGIGLLILFVSFFMIGIGAESKVEERKANYSFFGFILLMVSVLMLGTVVMINTLSGS